MKSLAELQAIKAKMQNKVNLRTSDDENAVRVVVGMATCGIAAGARPVLNAFLKEISATQQAIEAPIYKQGYPGMLYLLLPIFSLPSKDI